MPSDIRARRVYTSSVPYLHLQESRSTSSSLPARQGAPGSAQRSSAASECRAPGKLVLGAPRTQPQLDETIALAARTRIRCQLLVTGEVIRWEKPSTDLRCRHRPGLDSRAALQLGSGGTNTYEHTPGPEGKRHGTACRCTSCKQLLMRARENAEAGTTGEGTFHVRHADQDHAGETGVAVART